MGEGLPWWPGVGTPCFQHREYRFDPWSGKQDPTCPWHDKKKIRERERWWENQKEAGLLQVEGEADLLHLMVKQRT